MPVHRYSCPEHGIFDIKQPICEEVLPTWRCPVGVGIPDFPGDTRPITLYACGIESPWVPSAPAGIIIEGGTGAGRQINKRRKDAREQFREEHKLE